MSVASYEAVSVSITQPLQLGTRYESSDWCAVPCSTWNFNAMLLTKCLAFALDGAYEKFANLGREIGAATAEDDDKTASEKFIEALNEICKICEIPTLFRIWHSKR